MKLIKCCKDYLGTAKLLIVLVFLLVANSNYSQNKNPYVVQADKTFKNEAYFDAIDLYKKGEVKVKDIVEKGRINFQIAECYRLDVEPAQAETYYKRAMKLKYQKDHPKLLILLADVLVEQAEYENALEYIKKYLEFYPKDDHAVKLLSTCEHFSEWVKNKTKHIIQNEKQINSEHYDYSPAWGDIDHNTIIFVSARDGSLGNGIDSRTGDSYMDLWSTTRDPGNGKWFEPQLLPNTINSKDNEGSAVLSPMGDKIYFTRCPRLKKVNLGCEIFYSERKGDSWSQSKKINLKPEGGDTLSCGHPAMDSEMKFMIFSADFPGGFGSHDLWISEYDERESNWMSPVNLGSSINTSGEEMFPYISDDGSLYFSSDGYEGFGGLDIFKSYSLGDKKWGNVENLRYPMNSSEHDYGIIFERNTDRRGVFTSSRKGTKGKDDIWNFNIPPVLFRYGVEVNNRETGDPVPGATILVRAIDTSGGIVAEYVQTTDIDGTILFNEISDGKRYIEENLIYEVECQKDSFLIRKSKFSTINMENSHIFYDAFEVQPTITATGEIIEIKIEEQILFVFDKAVLLVDTLETTLNKVNSKDSLEVLYNVLIDNPKMNIELNAHSDCRGSDDYNLELSQRRAQACVEYLITKGISVERMKAVGYGESKPIEGLECDAIEGLSTVEEQEAAHQKNRRCSFIPVYEGTPKDN